MSQETTGILKCVTKVEQIMLSLSEKTNARAPVPQSNSNFDREAKGHSDYSQERALFKNCLRTL